MNRDHEPLARKIMQTLPTSSTLSKFSILFYRRTERIKSHLNLSFCKRRICKRLKFVVIVTLFK